MCLFDEEHPGCMVEISSEGDRAEVAVVVIQEDSRAWLSNS